MTHRFAILTPPGLASAAEKELEFRGCEYSDAKRVLLRNHDLILASLEKDSIKSLLRLQTAGDIFLVLREEVPVPTQKELKYLLGKDFKGNLLRALAFLPPRQKKSPATNVAIFIKKDTDRDVYKRDIHDTISTYLGANFSNWREREPADVELWCFHSKEKVTIALRLTTKRKKKGEYKEVERPGSLPTSIAAALALFSDPKAEDVVFDPMCGTGTVLIERGLMAPAARIIGSEIDEEALKLAIDNSSRAKVAVEWSAKDALAPKSFQHLKGEVTKLICNLPFGKKFEKEADLKELYINAISNWKSVLSGTGRMILLTPRVDDLYYAARKSGLTTSQIGRLRLKGLKVGVFEVK